MTVSELAEGSYIIPGVVNVYLLDLPGGLTLIDTGFPRSAAKILKGMSAIGRSPSDLRHILLTHAHPDHIGGAAEIRTITGAKVYAHGDDAPIVQTGGPFRPIRPAPGLRNAIVVAFLSRMFTRVAPTPVDGLLKDGEAVPFASDLVAVHIPGHCAGQVAFHWKKGGGLLMAADACINRGDMVLAAAQEDVSEARRSLTKLAGLSFDVACFGHGPPILTQADQRFRRRWLEEVDKV